MKLSGRRRNALYAAIHDAVIDLRIDLRAGMNPNSRSQAADDVDARVARAELEIWHRVLRALDAEDTHA